MRGHRALCQVSTSCSKYTALLLTALEGCRRQQALFQAAGDVSWDFHTSIVPTKGSYKDVVQGHTSVLHRSQRAMPFGERPRTHLIILARQPDLVEMT